MELKDTLVTGGAVLAVGTSSFVGGNAVVDKTKLIVLYCQGGFRSALAGENLKKMGYENVLSMKGGYSDWLNHNFPIDKP